MSVPRMVQMLRCVAKMMFGLRVDSRARFRYVKHSMSCMWTLSINSTPGTSSAMPWSMYRFTTLLISRRSFTVISVFLGFVVALYSAFSAVSKRPPEQFFTPSAGPSPLPMWKMAKVPS